MRTLIRILALSCVYFLLTSVITGCKTITSPTPAAKLAWKEREQRLNRIQAWHLNGKVGIQTANDSGSASLDWIQQSSRYHFSLLGPLGSGGFQLSGQPGRVTLVTSDGKQYTAANPEQLLAQRTGFHLPVSYLYYWIRGLPAPNAPSQNQWDTYNRLTSLVQDGWRVQFLSYVNTGGIDLPEKLTITSTSLKVKMIVYEWKL